MSTITLETAFGSLTQNREKIAALSQRLRDQMSRPVRAYHNEQHIADVLATIFAWSPDGTPSAPLIAAALYHDVIYDPKRGDNELQSAVFCHDELVGLGVPVIDVLQATNLILATAYHRPHLKNTDEVTMIDADLFILGSEPEVYAAYARAIRNEYVYVSDADWRIGRASVMERFLQRERIYWGKWEGRDEREVQARANITAEIEGLA